MQRIIEICLNALDLHALLAVHFVVRKREILWKDEKERILVENIIRFFSTMHIYGAGVKTRHGWERV